MKFLDLIKRFLALEGIYGPEPGCGFSMYSTPFFAPGGGSSGRGYQIDNSLRFRSSASAYLSRTFSAPTDNNRFTFSGWVKRGTLGSTQNLMDAYVPATSFDSMRFNSDDTFQYFDHTTGYVTTSRVFRDPTAHIHVVVAVNTDEATAADRVKIYFNGVQETSFSATGYPGLNQATKFNSAIAHGIGRFGYSANAYLDGLLSDVHFIDGQALTPSSFGEQNADGVWVPKAYAGTYGNNGFHLNFADAAVTSGSNAGLGKDVSGNGNYWNTTNISVTSGVTYDALTDTPTNNYPTWNPLKLGSGGTLAAGNLDVTTSGAARPVIPSTMAMRTGQWYMEVPIQTGMNSAIMGVVKESAQVSEDAWTGSNALGYVYETADSFKKTAASTYTSLTGSIPSVPYTLGLAFDADNGTLEFFENNTSVGSLTGLTTGIAWYWMCGDISGGTAVTTAISANFGQRFFTYTPPSGFKSLCTANLPSVAVTKPASHFDVKTYTGNASTQSITGLLFQPDLVWMKSRGRAVDHALFDAVRGVQKMLESNQTGAESTETTGLTAFNSDGWTMGSLDQINSTTATNSYVGWAWKANGAGSSNTAGTITSTVSANTTAGFSIVTYTGTGANATVGHGLGVAPKMIIVKNKADGSASWFIWHDKLTSSAYRLAFDTVAETNSPTAWNSTAPTSSVFSVGASSNTNGSTNGMVAYCFAEVPGYSKFGNYTGNNNADGPFVYCGFRPKWVLLKIATASTDSWVIYDSARNTYNVMNLQLLPDTSGADYSQANSLIDFTANGFKIRGDMNRINYSTATYIFAAFAEHPFGGSNVAPAPAR